MEVKSMPYFKQHNGNNSNLYNNNNGIFNAISAGGVGTYTITYTFVDGNGCETSDQMVVVVDPSIAVLSDSENPS
mgnify:CR=1 FL=1